jgi:hypothetical protein
LLTRLIALLVLSGAGATVGCKKTAAIRQKQKVRFLADIEKDGEAPPGAEEKIGRQQFCRLFDPFQGKNWYSGAHAPEAHDREDLENLHLSEKNRALDCRLA